jgi:hypothetical protein
MKYKAGDRVRIRSKEWIDAQEKGWNGAIGGFVKDMFQYAGMEAVIQRVRNGWYVLDIDDREWNWTEDMLDPDYTPADRPLSLKDEPLSPEDAIQAMIDGETLYNEDGDECRWVNDEDAFFYFHDNSSGEPIFRFCDLYRRPAKRKRVWTRWEILDWANSPESRGWAVRQVGNEEWLCPQALFYDLDTDRYERARFSRDGVDTSTIQGFEVEE